MIDEKKIYTKKEFEDLMNMHFLNLIQYYEVRTDKKLFDYYVVAGYPLTEKQHDSNKYGYMYLFKYREMEKIIPLVKGAIHNNPKKTPNDFLNYMHHNNIKDDEASFYHGYMQGINAVIRYLKNLPEDIGIKRKELWDGFLLERIAKK